MFTRGQYLAGECSHQEYYGQFVNHSIIDSVRCQFGVNQLINAHEIDEHFNSIALCRWDERNIMSSVNQELWKAANGSRYHSLSDNLCIKKAAAKIIVEEYSSEQNATV